MIGILLAGGESRRFGSPKAFADLNGEAFYERMLKALSGLCEHTIIVTNPSLFELFPDHLDLITDLASIKGRGPLAGIYSAMETYDAAEYFVVPCDMPYLTPGILNSIVDAATRKADVTALKSGDHFLPLVGIWNVKIKRELRNELDSKNLRVLSFLKKINTEWIDCKKIHKDLSVFENINTTNF